MIISEMIFLLRKNMRGYTFLLRTKFIRK